MDEELLFIVLVLAVAVGLVVLLSLLGAWLYRNVKAQQDKAAAMMKRGDEQLTHSEEQQRRSDELVARWEAITARAEALLSRLEATGKTTDQH